MVGLAILAVAGAAAADEGVRYVGSHASPCLNLRAGASASAAALGCIEPGVRVLELEAREAWSRVRLADGQEGWMARGYLATSAPSSARSTSAFSDTTLRIQDAVVPGGPAPLGMTLYDQTDLPLGAGFASQVFEPANAAFDCRAGDDFTVPPAEIQWDISSLTALGAYISGVGPTPLIDVEFFADAGGVPGAVPSCSYIGLVAGVDFTDVAGTFAIDLPTVCSLPSGAYWVSVRADMDQAAGGQWLWQMRTTQANAQFAWENPGDGFGTGCTSWTPAGACGAAGADLLFSLSGVVVPVELQSFSID